MLSIFATGFVIAREGSDDSGDDEFDDSSDNGYDDSSIPAAITTDAATVSSEVSASSVQEDELATLDDQTAVGIDAKYKAFPNILAAVGSGYYVNSNNEAGFAGIAIVQKKFVSSTDTNDVRIISAGRLSLAGDKKYRLIRTITSGENVIEDSATFDVYREKNKVGTLTLNADKKYTGLTIYTGTLKLDSGNIDLTLAVKTKLLSQKPKHENSGRGSVKSGDNGNSGSSDSVNSGKGSVGPLPAEQVGGFRGLWKRVFGGNLERANAEARIKAQAVTAQPSN